MKDKEVYIKTKDYSVTRDEFDLVFEEKYNALQTTPSPTPEEIYRYYESEDYISHTDGNRNLFEKVYQLVKSFALKGKLKLVN
ncbi:MAG: methyltransferase, partial [Flavobacterium sp.]